MGMLFSQRNGLKPVSEVIQHNSMTPELRSMLSCTSFISYLKSGMA